MVSKLSLQDLPVNGKKVLMRVDFNVPLDNNANITDDTRIVASLPSIRFIIEHGGAVILMSHLGRPKGQRQKEFSLASCAKRLGELLQKPVKLAPDCIGSETEALAKSLRPGEILLLENLRFHSAEEEPGRDTAFAQKLARLGDVYVNDAFGTAHRAHSSTATVAQYFPNKAAAGLLLQKEIQFLGDHLDKPDRPFYAVVGGKKISTKLGVLQSLLKKADALFLGGAMAFTFLKAKGISVGNSLVEDDLIAKAKEILSEADKLKVKIWLPIDVVVVPRLDELATAERIITVADGVPAGMMGVDIGPKTQTLYAEELKKASCILWNGPMGVFELPQFARGTEEIARALADLDAITIVGGGDSIAAIQGLGLGNKMSHLSTGGGATLEYIEFGSLPGINALSNASQKAASRN